MAKHQTRKSISFSQVVYEAVQRTAKKQGKSLAHFAEDAFRIAGVDLPPTTRMKIADVKRAVKNRPDQTKTVPQKKSLPLLKAQAPKPKLKPSAASLRSTHYASLRTKEHATKPQPEPAKPPPPLPPTRREGPESAKPPSPLKEEQPLTRREGPIRKALGDAVADWAGEP